MVFFAHCILSRIESKDLQYFPCCANIYRTEFGQDLTHLAHKVNTQSDIFLWDRRKILIAFFSLGALLYSNILSPMVEILTLWSPQKLLKNLGALCKYAKCSQSSKKKFEILTLFPEYVGMVKKTISRYCLQELVMQSEFFPTLG
jgi:hypothetical protein